MCRLVKLWKATGEQKLSNHKKRKKSTEKLNGLCHLFKAEYLKIVQPDTLPTEAIDSTKLSKDGNGDFPIV